MTFTDVPPKDLTQLKDWMAFNLGIKEPDKIEKKCPFDYIYVPGINIVDYSLKRIKRSVCKHMGIAIKDLDECKKQRSREYVYPRYLVWKLYNEFHPTTSLKMLGSFFGKDHTSALHGLRQVKNLIETDKYFRAKYQRIKDDLQNN